MLIRNFLVASSWNNDNHVPYQESFSNVVGPILSKPVPRLDRKKTRLGPFAIPTKWPPFWNFIDPPLSLSFRISEFKFEGENYRRFSNSNEISEKKKKEEKKSQLSIYLKLPFRLIGRLHAKSGRDFCLFLFSNCRRVSKRWRCRSVEGKEKKSGGRGGGRSAQLHRGAKDRGTWTIESGNSRPRGRHFLLCRPFLRRMSCRVYLCDGRN